MSGFKVIEVPGQGDIEFPDTMSDDEISAVLRKQFPPTNQPPPLAMGTQNRFMVNPPSLDTLWGGVKDLGEGAWRGVKGMASMPGQFIESQAEPAYEALNAYRSGDYGTALKQGIRAATPLLPMAEGMGQDSGGRLVEATRLAKEGQGLAAVAKAGTAIPMVGPMAEVWGEDVASGHPLRAVGEAATFALLPGAARGAPEIAGAVRSGAARVAPALREAVSIAKDASKTKIRFYSPTAGEAAFTTAAGVVGGPQAAATVYGLLKIPRVMKAIAKGRAARRAITEAKAQGELLKMSDEALYQEALAQKQIDAVETKVLKADLKRERTMAKMDGKAKPEGPKIDEGTGLPLNEDGSVTMNVGGVEIKIDPARLKPRAENVRGPYIKPQEPGSVEARLAPPVVPETVVPRSTMPSRPLEPDPEPPVVTSAPEGAGSLPPAVLEPPAPSGMHPWAAQMVERIKGKSPEEARAILASADVKPAQVKLFMDLAEIEPSPASLPVSPVSDVVTAPPAFEGQQGAPFVKGRTLPGAEDRLSFLRRTEAERGDAPAKLAEKLAENKTKGSELAAALETPEPAKPAPPTPYRPKITDTARDVNKAIPSVNKAVLDRFKAMKVQALSKEAPEVFQGVKESIAKREGISGAKAELKMRQMPQEELAREVQTVYHGSPHLFEKFELSDKTIGTGEGAQAYGHGLYFAENPGTAMGYQAQLSQYGKLVTGDGGTIDIPSMPEGARKIAAQVLSREPDVSKAVFTVGNYSKETFPKGVTSADVVSEIKNLASEKARPTGNLYKAEIPKKHIDRMLDWDKPLGEQPEIVSALKDAGVITGERKFDNWDAWIGPGGIYLDKAGMGNRAYIVAQSQLGDVAASKLFTKAGIPGIKYLDAGSRVAGSGTRNFVVFDDSIINTVERNGQPIKPPAEAVAKIKPSKSSIARAEHAAKQAEKKANMAKRRKKEK